MDLARRRRQPAEGEEVPERDDLALTLHDRQADPNLEQAEANRDGETGVHPFWSERAHLERELQLLRPPALDEATGNANITSTASSSTELRPSSTGLEGLATAMAHSEAMQPPEATLRTGLEGGEGADFGRQDGVSGLETASVQGVTSGPGAIPMASVTASTPIAASSVQVPTQTSRQTPREAQDSHSQQMGSTERLGMRPGERLIVEEMKNLLVGLYEQKPRVKKHFNVGLSKWKMTLCIRPRQAEK